MKVQIYATDCNYQNKTRNQFFVINNNLILKVIVGYHFILIIATLKKVKMNFIQKHHGHHGNNQSKGRL